MVTEVVDGVVVAEDELPQQDLVPYQARPLNLFGADSPAEVVAQATQYADALADVLEQRRLYTTIQGKKHVLVEGWTMLGSMLGVFPVLESAEPVDYAGVKGWRATVAAQTRTGDVVGRATALCLRSENRWRNADDYAVLSMAQTRATSKCLRAPLGFIVQLAGFAPTPEAEIPPEAAPAAPPPRQGADDKGTPNPKVSKAKNAKYWATLAELEREHPRPDGKNWADLSRAWMQRKFQVASHTELDSEQFTELLNRTIGHLEAANVPFGDPAEERAVVEELEAIAE